MSDEFQQIFQSELVDILGDCGNIEKLCELKNFLLQYLFNQDPVSIPSKLLWNKNELCAVIDQPPIEVVEIIIAFFTWGIAEKPSQDILKKWSEYNIAFYASLYHFYAANANPSHRNFYGYELWQW